MSALAGVLGGVLIDTYLPVPTLPGSWAPPSSSEWTAALAAITAMDALSGYVLVAEATGLQTTAGGANGVSDSTLIGGVPNWLDPDIIVQSSGDERPTYTTVSSVTALVFDGDETISGNDRLNLTHVDWPVGSFAAVIRMTDDSSRGTVDQTLMQTASLRAIARQSDSDPTPAVRVGSGHYEGLDGGSIYNAWALFEGEWDTGTSLLRIRRNGQEWQSLDTTPYGWMTNTSSLIARSSYEPTNGAPFAGAIHKLMLLPSIPTFAQWATLRAFMLASTAITESTPTEPASPADEEIPQPLIIANAVNTSTLASALSGATAGTHIVLANSTYTWPSTITASGTAENPIVIRSANLLQAIVNGTTTISGSNIYIVGLSLRDEITMTGSNIRVVRWVGRDRTSNGQYFTNTGTDNVLGYFSVADLSPTDSAVVDDQPRNGARRLRVHNGFMANYRRLAIKLGNQESDSRVNCEALVEDCLFDGENTVPSDSSAAYHWLEIKTSGCIVRRCSVINTASGKGSMSIRHGTNNLFIDCKSTGGAGIYLADRDNSVHNCDISSRIRVSYGNQPAIDGQITFGGSNYIQSLRNVISYCASAVSVGDSFGTYVYPADDTRIRNHQSGTITLVSGRQVNTTQSGTNPFPAPAGAPEVVDEADTGPNATGVGYSLDGLATSAPSVSQMFANPFSSQSAFHRPIGTGATFSSTAPFAGYSDGTVADNNVFSNQSVLDTTSAVVQFTDSGILSGVGLPFSIRFPTSGFPTYTTDTTYDCVTTVVNEDYLGHDIYKTDTRSGVRKAAIHRSFDIRGLGHGTVAGYGNRVGSSAAGNAVFAGTIRKTEFETPGQVIGHAHHIALPWSAPNAFINRRFQLPAVCHDGFGETNDVNAPCAMGELLAIKASSLSAVLSAINALAISSTAKEMCGRYATAFCHYGIYVTDSAGQISFRADGVLDATLKAAFITFIQDVLWTYLFRVTNSVTGATGTITTGAVLTGSAGTLTYPAGGGTALAANTALVA